MNEQFVTYKIAKKLKELGFDQECFGFFESKTSVIYPFMNRNLKAATAAPLWQQAIEFLDKENLHCYSTPHSLGWMGHIKFIDSGNDMHWTHPPVDTYINGLEQSLLEAINYVERKKN